MNASGIGISKWFPIWKVLDVTFGSLENTWNKCNVTNVSDQRVEE